MTYYQDQAYYRDKIDISSITLNTFHPLGRSNIFILCTISSFIPSVSFDIKSYIWGSDKYMQDNISQIHEIFFVYVCHYRTRLATIFNCEVSNVIMSQLRNKTGMYTRGSSQQTSETTKDDNYDKIFEWLGV